MPKRTNDFQQVIYMLQRQLADQATVTESKLLQNKDTGAEAEVDVVIETVVNAMPLVIGVECTATKRPANIEWVQKIYGKHHSLPVHVTVLVSKNGYTKNALNQAEAFNMLALTIKEAEETQWVDVLDDLKTLALGYFRFTILNGKVHYDRSPASAPDLVVSPHLIVNRGLPGDPISFSELNKAIVSDSRMAPEVMRRWLTIAREKRPSQFEFIINWRPTQETIVTNNGEHAYRITQLDLTIKADIETTPLLLKPGEFSGEKIAYGTANNIFENSGDQKRPVVIAMTLSQAGITYSSMMIPKFDGGADKVFDMTITNAAGGDQPKNRVERIKQNNRK